MMIGELIFEAGSDGVFTPGVPSQGSIGMFTVEVSQISGTSPSLAIEIQSRNHDESGWASVGTIAALTTLAAR